jgi:hypothetical protein
MPEREISATSLDTQDQEVVCHVMDSLIRKERMKAILDDRMPRGG